MHSTQQAPKKYIVTQAVIDSISGLLNFLTKYTPAEFPQKLAQEVIGVFQRQGNITEVVEPKKPETKKVEEIKKAEESKKVDEVENTPTE
jgi:hypothetical protein